MLAKLDELQALRRHVLERGTEVDEHTAAYSNIIKYLLSHIAGIANASHNPAELRRGMVLEHLLIAQEYAGQERVLLVTATERKEMSAAHASAWLTLVVKQEEHLELAMSITNDSNLRSDIESLLRSEETARVKELRREIQSLTQPAQTVVSSTTWFDAASARIESIASLRRVVRQPLCEAN